MSGNGAISVYGLYIGSDAWVTCHHYEGKTPILAISAEGTSFSVGIKDRAASDNAAVEFARVLLRSVQEFADDVERLHAEQTASDESADQAA